MALRIRQDAEGRTGDTLRRLDRPAAELLGSRECLLDVLDAHEEQDGIGTALEGSDSGRKCSRDQGRSAKYS